jgi:hypothetical protein
MDGSSGLAQGLTSLGKSRLPRPNGKPVLTCICRLELVYGSPECSHHRLKWCFFTLGNERYSAARFDLFPKRPKCRSLHGSVCMWPDYAAFILLANVRSRPCQLAKRSRVPPLPSLSTTSTSPRESYQVATAPYNILGGRVLVDDFGYGKTAITLDLIDSTQSANDLPEEMDGAIPVTASVLLVDRPAAIPTGPAVRSTYKALISIGGMTCSVCSGTGTEI